MKTVQKTLTATANATAKGFSAYVTVETVDRDGDVVVAQGMNSRNYERNPILLVAHDVQDIPVGKCVAIRRREAGIEMDFTLTPKPDGWSGDWEPERVGAAIAHGALNAVSIRFRGLPGGVRRATQGDIAKYGEDCVQVYSKWELLEVSVVSIPANQEALIYAVAKAAKLGVPVVPDRPKSHRIVVPVPALGYEDIRQIAREELARASGQLFYRPV